MKIRNNRGFTLIELMIATAVFSVVLLVCLGAIIYVGRLYYKGISSANTLDTTREAIELVSEAVQFSGEDIIDLGFDPSPNVAAGEWSGGYCISGVKYSYRLNTQLRNESPGTGQAQDVLVTSIDPGCTETSSPEPIGTQRRELLKQDMRLTAFSVATGTSGLTEIEVGVAFGGDPTDVSVERDTFRFAVENDETSAILTCKPSGTATAFCATSYLSTSVKRRVQ